MIASLRGKLLEKHPNQLIVEAGGVGYDVAIPVSTFSAVPEPGMEVTLKIHTHVREDTLQLYGFATREEKTVFERLITVSGIGPKLAITILSGIPLEELVRAIGQGESTRLVRIPGVGKKTAERIILELRDKMPAASGQAATAAPGSAAPALSAVEEDVLSALKNLGCTAAAAEAAVRKARLAGTPLEFEAMFRTAMEAIR